MDEGGLDVEEEQEQQNGEAETMLTFDQFQPVSFAPIIDWGTFLITTGEL